jgi:hypothetical protein
LGSPDCSEPSLLPGCFDGAGVVIAAYPGHGLVRRKTIKDGQRGKRGSCSADATAAYNLDTFAVASTAESLVQSIKGVHAVTGNPEIEPTNVATRPARRAGAAQNQGKVRGADLVARAPSTHSGAGWESDQPGVVQPGDAGHEGTAGPTARLITVMIPSLRIRFVPDANVKQAVVVSLTDH